MVGEPMRSKETIREEIRRTTERLNSYYAREKEMLEGGIHSRLTKPSAISDLSQCYSGRNPQA